MRVHCFASISLDGDNPAACIRQFVRLLGRCSVDCERAEVDVKLVGVSARAQTTIKQFQPGRAKGVAFAKALAIAEELTSLGVAKTKSLHFFLTARGFRWAGSWTASSASLVLSDSKFLQGKQRFALTAHLIFEAADSTDPSMDQMLATIASTTGILFRMDASTMQIGSGEPGRATATELLATALTWREVLERTGRRVRESIDLAGIPYLMTRQQTHDLLFDPAKLGKSARVDFSRIVRKWLKHEFPDFSKSGGPLDGETLEKRIGDDLLVTLNIDKPSRPFAKRFTVQFGIALSSARFAPAPDRPLRIGANLFELFAIAPLPLEWTYSTEQDLLEALTACAHLVHRALAIFEHEAQPMRNAYARNLAEFAGPREVSARRAFDMAQPLARAWATDAALIGITTASVLAPCLSNLNTSMPSLSAKGCLALAGTWRIRFHSRTKQENLHIDVPWRGPIYQTRSEALHGRQWPSYTDHILRGGWLDSTDALSMAMAEVRKVTRREGWSEPSMELSSRANGLTTQVPGSPMKDGMFAMEPAWRLFFTQKSTEARTTATVTVTVTVTVPAHGDGSITVEVQTYDMYGAAVVPPGSALPGPSSGQLS